MFCALSVLLVLKYWKKKNKELLDNVPDDLDMLVPPNVIKPEDATK